MESFSVHGQQKSWFDRNGFPPFLVGIVWLVLAFVLFHGVGTLASILLIYYKEGGFSEQLMVNNPEILLIGNSIGQIIGLAASTLIIAKLSALKFEYRPFMRFELPKSNIGAIFGYSFLLILVVQPAIWLVSWLNQQIPLPDTWIEMELIQMELLESMLLSGIPLTVMITTIAVVPAICEEVLFRSYLLRLFEKSAGVISAIIITGIMFGAFHLRITQIIPLSVIGILLAWVTIKSGSILPAIFMHFIHNGATVVAVHYYPELIELESVDALPPSWMIALSFVLTGFFLYLYQRLTSTQTESLYVR